jgi:hypothetical protein
LNRKTTREKNYGLEQTPEQKRWQEKHQREHEQFTRSKNNALRFWRACRNKPCRRAHACAGEPHECFRVNWARTPIEVKEWYRAGIKARAEGYPPEEAKRRADAAFIRAVLQQQAQEQAAAAIPKPAAQLPRASEPPREPDAPRLRRL